MASNDYSPINGAELPFTTKGTSILNAYGVQLAVCRIEDEATAICTLINAGHALINQSASETLTATQQVERRRRGLAAIIQAQEYLRIAAELV